RRRLAAAARPLELPDGGDRLGRAADVEELPRLPDLAGPEPMLEEGADADASTTLRVWPVLHHHRHEAALRQVLRRRRGIAIQVQQLVIQIEDRCIDGQT